MSDAFKCDRCGSFDDSVPPVNMEHSSREGECSIGNRISKTDMEFCMECGVQFVDWYNQSGSNE